MNSKIPLFIRGRCPTTHISIIFCTHKTMADLADRQFTDLTISHLFGFSLIYPLKVSGFKALLVVILYFICVIGMCSTSTKYPTRLAL